MDQEAHSLTLSVIVPVMNEAANIEELVGRTRRSLDEIGVSWELILVDDGSSDDTWPTIQTFAAKHPEVHGLSLSRNFGHQNALLAGLQNASGEAVVSLDGDLQHPPEVIPELFEQWRDGADIVKTRRQSSKDSSLFKRLTSRWFYRVFSVLSGLPAEAGMSDFRLIDRRIVPVLTRMRDPNPFLRGLVEWAGYDSSTVAYQAAPRAGGRSKYDFRKMLKFATSAVVSFSTIPLKIALWFGFLTSVLSFVTIVYGVVLFFLGVTVPGWASLVTLTAFMFGVLFIVLGILGLYLGSIHEAIKNRPRYLIREVANGKTGMSNAGARSSLQDDPETHSR